MTGRWLETRPDRPTASRQKFVTCEPGCGRSRIYWNLYYIADRPLICYQRAGWSREKELTTPEPLNTCISIAILFKEHDRIAKISPSDHAPHTHSPILNCPTHVPRIGPAQLLSRSKNRRLDHLRRVQHQRNHALSPLPPKHRQPQDTNPDRELSDQQRQRVPRLHLQERDTVHPEPLWQHCDRTGKPVPVSHRWKSDSGRPVLQLAIPVLLPLRHQRNC